MATSRLVTGRAPGRRRHHPRGDVPMTRAPRLRRLIVVAASVGLVAGLAGQALAKPPGGSPSEGKATTTEIQILGLNDFHGQLREPDSTSSGGRIGATNAGGAEYLA